MDNVSIYTLDTEASHVRDMGNILRQRYDYGDTTDHLPAHRALWRAYKNSLFCKTAFINDNIAAIWGVSAEPMSGAGRPWMVASSAIDDYPLKVAFRYRKELKDMLKCFPMLEDWVEIDNTKAIRMLSILGFKMADAPSFVKDNKIFIKATMVG